jgi:hypothetical protein
MEQSNCQCWVCYYRYVKTQTDVKELKTKTQLLTTKVVLSHDLLLIAPMDVKKIIKKSILYSQKRYRPTITLQAQNIIRYTDSS